MPAVKIEVRKEYTQDQEIAIIDAVYKAIKEAFKLLPYDKDIRFVSYEPHRFAAPTNLEKPELFTLVSVEAFSGRSIEAKRELYTKIVDNLEALEIPKNHVKIILHEIPKENWGIRGGQAGCDVELGFDINV